MIELRALSLTSPWPWAVLQLGKTIENRTRLPNPGFRGVLAIHASRRKSQRSTDEAFLQIRDAMGHEPPRSSLAAVEGAIVGVVWVVAVCDPTGRITYGGDYPPRQISQDERRWWFGKSAYVLADPQVLAEPVPCPGMLGIWKIPAGVAQAVLGQIKGIP